jgi:ABC-type uncharacterized transport system permease subunit
MDLITDLIAVLLALFFYRILYFNLGKGLHVPLSDLYLLVISVKIVTDIYAFLFASNIRSLPRNVQYGNLDQLLIKPLNLFFLLYCCRINFKAITALLIDGALLIIFFNQFGIALHPLRIVSYFFVLLMAVAVYTAFHILIYLGSIIFVRLDAFTSLLTSFFTLSTYPKVIFSNIYLKWFFIYIVPVIVIGNFPLQAFNGEQTPAFYIIMLICPILFVSLALFSTKRMMKYYKSSSS